MLGRCRLLALTGSCTLSAQLPSTSQSPPRLRWTRVQGLLWKPPGSPPSAARSTQHPAPSTQHPARTWKGSGMSGGQPRHTGAGRLLFSPALALTLILAVSQELVRVDSKIIARKEHQDASGFTFLAHFCFLPRSALTNEGRLPEGGVNYMWNNMQVRESGFSFDIYANASDQLHLAIYFRGSNRNQGTYARPLPSSRFLRFSLVPSACLLTAPHPRYLSHGTQP